MSDALDPARSAFATAVLDSPMDASPKLVYADWLDETGHEIDAQLARTLRWMAAFHKWPRVWLGMGFYSGWNRGFMSAWLGFKTVPPKLWDEWKPEHVLPASVAARLAADGMPLPYPGQARRIGRRVGRQYDFGLTETTAHAAAVAIEALSNALTDDDMRRAYRRLCKPAAA